MFYLNKKNGKWDKQSQEILNNAKDGYYRLDNSKKRSNEQNAYIHAVLFPLIRDWWNDNKPEKDPMASIDDIKDWVQNQGYWGYKTVGKETIPKRSSEATTLEMMTGISQLQIRFAKIGLVIPDPEQTEFLDETQTL
jgi:hypothetical protein